MVLNHMLFIDDLKLFTCDTGLFDKLLNKIKELLAEVILNLNAYKYICSSDYTKVITFTELLIVNKIISYKYLGFF